MEISAVSLRVMVAAAAIATVGVAATPSAAAAQAPAGSYAKSCRNISTSRDGYLRAECQTPWGKWNTSSVRISDCRGRDIANNKGTLVCGAAYDNNDRGDGRWNNGRGPGDRGHGRGPDRGGWYGNGRDSRGSGLVLYTGTRFRGRSMTIREDYTNLATTGFNDAVSSVRIMGRGTWRLCSDKEYGGRCVNVSSDAGDLSAIGLRGKVSSIRQVN